MYYSNGNFEAFARPEKPVDVDKKSAYLVGSVMELRIIRKALLFVEDVKWKTTLNVCRICFVQFLL